VCLLLVLLLYTGWFMARGPYSTRWFPKSLCSKNKLIWRWVLFSTVMELWVCFNCRKRPPVNRASQVNTPRPWTSRTETVFRSCKWQVALFTTERRGEWVRGVAFSKICWRTVQCKLKAISCSNINLYFKFFRYYACVLFCSIYF
jgi:hypothetical protein